ncbi:gastrula zinc finger protein XlCGF49.1-like [Pimephales promelas]|uniref:gastrula zinc finger protein XlCGF49.1-like n=1 Tax=Pimephales promelas TaxID=90988 RepID=UPI001955A6E8|nr:gastrula zinc finger protein XlCGF49.1-like [Pimephales promelas]
MVFVKEESEEDMSEPEPWRRIKHEEQGGLIKVKEERPDLNEVEEKHQHQKAHDVTAGEKPLSCSKTEKSSIQITDVKRLFVCSECGNTFTRKENLKNHMIIHTGLKPFSCSQCGKSFKYKNCLNVHLITHMSKKPFSCSQCGNTFTSRESCKTHMRLHTGKKPFSCSQCGKSFTFKQGLNSHMRNHSEEMSYACHLCEKRFKWNTSLKAHLRHSHSATRQRRDTVRNRKAVESGSDGAAQHTRGQSAVEGVSIHDGGRDGE